jgi:multiple sugar transport system substrate-binding protein
MLPILAGVMLASGCSSGTKEEASASPTAAAKVTAAATAEPTKTPPPKEKVTIEFWHAYGEGEEKVLLEEVLPAFEKANPSIKVKATRMPTENLKQQVITAAAGSAVPDLMRMDIVWVPEFASLDALQPVDGFPDFSKIKAASFDAPMSTNLYNGKYYGVPLDTNTKVAIYNKALLQEAGAAEPPKTMDELADLARKLKAKDKKKFGITIGGPDAWNMPPFFWSLGGKYTDDKYTKATGFLNSPESVKALETIISWNEEGLLAPPILGGQPGTWEGLRGDKGQPASYMMINDGPWFFGILGDAVKGTMVPAKMPAGPDGKSHSIVGGQDMVIFKKAKHPNEAWTFTQFMLSEEIQVLMGQKTGAIPTNKNAAQSPKLKEVYYYQPYAQELETAYARTPSAQWGKIEEVLNQAFESALRKKSTPQQALDNAAKQIDELLAVKAK